MSQTISIFGATGSIGQSAVSVVTSANDSKGETAFGVEVVTAGQDVDGLARAATAVQARHAVIADPDRLSELRDALFGTGITCAAGPNAMVEAATRKVDRMLAAIVGSAGVQTTLAALEAGNDVALANKESMVCAGNLLLAAARKSGARIVPVDSEHNAMFQVLDAGRRPERLILTASGGPFRTTPLSALAHVTPAQAAAHPNWSMGQKNSIDSATLMNKALEFIEASYLFDMPEDRIEVLVHPQSIVHSLVGYPDGSVLAQLGVTDMRTPIAHALMWPNAIRTDVPRLDLAAIAKLEFEPVDEKRFIAIQLARQAARAGCLASTVLNSANEVAVAAFVAGQCGFLDIASTVQRTLDAFCEGRFNTDVREENTLECVMLVHNVAANVAGDLLRRVRA